MRKLIAIIKNSLHTIVAIVAILVAAGYLINHFNLSGYIAKNALTGDIAEYLGTEVTLGSAEVDIFNQFVLENLLVKDKQADTLLFARRVMVSFDVLPLLQKELQIHTIQLIDFDFHLSKQDSLSDTNFQFLLDLIVPKEKKHRKKVIEDIEVNSIILRSGSLTYDDFSKEIKDQHLDINHLDINNISANLKIQSSKTDGLYVNLKRLSLSEKSGLEISRASTTIQLDADAKKLDVNDINIKCCQRIFSDYLASIDLVGFASMENKVLEGEIVALNVNVPEMLDIKTNARLNDILSLDQMTFDVDLQKLNITSHCMELLAESVADKYADNVSKYINNIYDINIEGSAKGALHEFSYNADVECYGELNGVVSLKGLSTKAQPLSCEIDADINNLEVKKHMYENITLYGYLTDKYFEGNAEINDPNCRISTQGKYLFDKKFRKIDATANIAYIEPYNLNFTDLKNFKDVGFSGNILANISFNKNNYPLGKLMVDSLIIARDSLSFYIPDIAFNAVAEDGYSATLNSSFADAIFRVDDNFETLQSVLQDSKMLSEIFQIPFSITKTASVNLQFDKNHKIVSTDISLPEINYSDAKLEILLASQRDADSLKHDLQLNCLKNENHLATKLKATTLFEPLYVDIQPCNIILNQDVFDCKGATLAKVSEDVYDLKRFEMKHKDQRVSAAGKIASDGRSDLAIHIEKLGIDTLCSFLSSNYLKFGGIGTGDLYYKSDSARYISTDNLYVENFSYLGGVLGNTILDATFNVDKTRVELVADIASKEDSITKLSGYIQIDKNDSLDLVIDANRLNAQFLKYWVGGFLENISGNLTGKLHLYGLAKELKLVGKPYADLSFSNSLTGIRLHYNDYVNMTNEEGEESAAFILDNARVFDKFNNEARATASIRHKWLRNFNYDVRIDFPDNNSGFLIFDKPTHYNNEIYWGQLFGSGSCVLTGGNGRHRIEISCSTKGKSQFNLSPGEENYSENGYSFLTFRDKKAYEKSLAEAVDTDNDSDVKKKANSSTYMEIDIQAEANENCQVFVQMDPLSEDHLLCRGTGNISFHYDPRHDITVGGEYNITSGTYLVTMKGDLLHKEFKIQNGSRVTFPGRLSNTELNINAIYSIPSVNLRDLDESFATMASMNRTTLPVDCKLAVAGQLSSPQITFDLEVKNTSDDVQALVHNLIGTQEMLNQEVFYLLLFSKFYTPEYASNTQNNTGSELSSFTSASLTSQLNNLLGHMSDYFTLGTNFRSDKGDFSDMEMDLSVSTRLLNDRLILNGNLGYRDPANRVGLNNNNNSFIGDFDVEYLINPKGTLRVKAYSHYNERDYSINNALTTQGIGFVIRKDYNSLKELLFRNKKTDK